MTLSFLLPPPLVGALDRDGGVSWDVCVCVCVCVCVYGCYDFPGQEIINPEAAVGIENIQHVMIQKGHALLTGPEQLSALW